MKTIELTDEAYATLLEFKNFWTCKLGEITNTEMLAYMKIVQDEHGVTYDLDKLFPPNKIDHEPTFTFSDLLIQLIESTMVEQHTGEVNYIT
jgi:hypothetical protein